MRVLINKKINGGEMFRILCIVGVIVFSGAALADSTVDGVYGSDDRDEVENYSFWHQRLAKAVAAQIGYSRFKKYGVNYLLKSKTLKDSRNLCPK